MDNFVSFVVFILSVLSVGSAIHMKSIKLSKNVIYDCMDIYKQPSLSHPLLKHHKIQKKPTGWDSQSENKFVDRRHENKIECPDGTVPILRTKKEHVIQSQEYPKNLFSILTAKYPGTHIAGMKVIEKHNYRGVQAAMRTYGLSIGKDQSSSAQSYVASGSNNDANSIQVGWMINEKLFGDSRPWSYGLWLGKHGTGCFNLLCPGFIQVAKNKPINEPLNGTGYLLWFNIHQDKETKHWWLLRTTQDNSQTELGYWPNELFNLLGNGADFVGYGGIVTSDSSGPSPPMGNGRLPNKDDRLWSASIDHLSIIDSNYTIVGADHIKLMSLVDSNKCYDVQYLGYVDKDVGVSMSYGGPGGYKCGDYVFIKAIQVIQEVINADFVGFGGIVTSDTRGPSPPMGNGRYPKKDDRLWSGSLDHLLIIQPNYTYAGFNDVMTEPLVDSKICYDVNYVGYVGEDVGIVVSYGGPGGIKCGD